jgi:PfaD family protein
MANGIATTDLVIAMAKNGMLGFFGAAGLDTARISEALDRLESALHGTGLSYGSNLIHSPNEPDAELATVQLYLKRGVRRVSASAYMQLTPMVVQYAFTGIHEDATGAVVRPNHLFAKISRPEVAERFLSPPPRPMLDALLADGRLTVDEVRLACRLPVAEDIIVESDSGGHTDNQTLGALFPSILEVRDRLVEQYNYIRPIRLGAAGGIGTPSAAAAAFMLGAAFIVTGSVNQASVEAGLSDAGKAMLADTDLADVVMAPAADMFELGVKVQVLSRGTLFGVRAHQLYDIYVRNSGLENLPDGVRTQLETKVFKRPLNDVWDDTERFFAQRDPSEVERAHTDPKHKMALVFRWYLGLSSRWAIDGNAPRRIDSQIWCGPAMGAFNRWVKGSFLEPLDARHAAQIARNLLEGAAIATRAQAMRTAGVLVPQSAFNPSPKPFV